MTGRPLRPVDSPFRGPGGTPPAPWRPHHSRRGPRHSRESGNPVPRRHHGRPHHSRPAPRHSRESGNPVPRPHHAPPPILPHPPPGAPQPAGRQPISRAAPIAYCAIVNNSVTYLTVALTTGQSFSPILAFGSREDTLKPRYNRPQAPGPRPQAPGPRPQAPGPRPQAPFRARRTPPGLSDSDMKNQNRPASPLPLTRKGAW